MSIPIQNAKDRKLNENTGTLPNLGEALLDWFQPMTFILLAKSVANFENLEVQTPIDTMGLWQPYKPQENDIKQEGQRNWTWFRMLTFPGSGLQTDYIIQYLGKPSRIMSVLDYTLEGYQEFKVVQDYL
jgi:hypothetical protein